MAISRTQSILAALMFLSTLGTVAPAQDPAQAQPQTQAPAPPPPPDWQANLLAWRAHRAESLAARGGWLTLVGLEWLQPGPNSVGRASNNRIQIQGQGPDHLGTFDFNAGPNGIPSTAPEVSPIRLLAPVGGFPPGLLLNDHPAAEGAIAPDDAAQPDTLSFGDITLTVIHRGDRYGLRIKDFNAPTRTQFTGLRWYAPNPRYRVLATWTPYTPAHILRIPTVLGTVDEMPAPGVATFTLPANESNPSVADNVSGKPTAASRTNTSRTNTSRTNTSKTYSLEPVLEDPESKQLFFIVKDLTSRTTTYGSGRFLNADFPTNGLDKPGQLVLDFNRLYNPPCAFTPYATCPLPPEQNRLSVAIPAGEERYSH